MEYQLIRSNRKTAALQVKGMAVSWYGHLTPPPILSQWFREDEKRTRLFWNSGLISYSSPEAYR